MEVDPDTVCNKAGHVALETIFGNSLRGFDPRTSDVANCILIWGANPSSCAPHTDKHWLAETRAQKIVVDPIRHPTAARADLHLQLRPGTDAALAFALLHVLAHERRIDRRFIEQNVHRLGCRRERSSAPARRIGGSGPRACHSDKIIEAARIYGAGPSLLWLGQGLQRQTTGGNVMRACSLLPIATGMIGKPGGGFLYMTGFPCRGVDMDYLVGASLRPAGSAGPISHMDLPARLEDARRDQGAGHMEQQYRGVEPAAAAHPAGTGTETLPRRRRPVAHRYDRLCRLVLPASSFSNSTILCCRISTTRFRRRSKLSRP